MLKDILKDFKDKYQSSPHMRQSANLLVWNMIGLPLGFITNIVVTRYMGAENYGNYLYIHRVLEFAYVILNFGLFRSVNRAVLLSKGDELKSREHYATSLLLLGGIYVVIAISLVISAFVLPDFREKGIISLFLCVVPFCFIYYFNHLYEQILPANNRIDLLIIERYGPKVSFFVLSALIYYCFSSEHYNPIIVIWTFFLSTQFIIYIYIMYVLKPKFSHIKERIQEIWKINKDYGVQVYLGDLGSTAFASLMPILIGTFSDTNVGVGFYSLALMLCSPLSYIPVVIATSHYSEFAHYQSIPRKLYVATLSFSVLALAMLWIVVTPFVTICYTPDFQPVIMLTFITSIGAILYALSDFISRYLAAQGDGISLRNSSWIVGITTMLMSLVLIPRFHATGASVTYVIAGLVYITVIFFYYRLRVKKNQSNVNKQ